MHVTTHVYSVFKRAARSGVPIFVAEAKRNIIMVETPLGRAPYIIRILKDIDRSRHRYIAVSIDYGIGEVILVEIDDEGEIKQVYPWRVPIAIALNIDMFSNYEADVWSKRIYWVENNQFNLVKEIGDIQVVKQPIEPCLAVRLKEEQIYLGWYNTLVGSLDCSGEWISKWFDVEKEKIVEACNLLRSVGMRYHDLPYSL